MGVLFSMKEEGVYVGSPCLENLYKNIPNIASNRKIVKAPMKTHKKSYILLCRLIDKYK